MKYVATLFAVVLFAAACAGPGGVAESGAVDQGDGADVSSEVDVERAAEALVGRLGSDEAAAEAVIISMELGYSSEQILGGAFSQTLRAGGEIDGLAPAGESLGLVSYDVSGEGEGAGARSLQTSPPRRGAAKLKAQTKTPVENLRSFGPDFGQDVTTFLLLLLNSGFDPVDLVEVLVLGPDETRLLPDRSGDEDVRCVRVVDEWYCPGGQRRPVVDDAADDSVTSEQPIVADDDRSEPGGRDATQVSTLDGTYGGEVRSDEFDAQSELSGGFTAVFDQGSLQSFSGRLEQFTPSRKVGDTEHCELRLILSIEGDVTSVKNTVAGFTLPVQTSIEEQDRCSSQTEPDVSTYELGGVSVTGQIDESGGLLVQVVNEAGPTGFYANLAQG